MAQISISGAVRGDVSLIIRKIPISRERKDRDEGNGEKSNSLVRKVLLYSRYEKT